MTKEITKFTYDNVSKIDREQDCIEIGQWYWVKGKDNQEWFGCVFKIGSNFIEIHAPRTHNGWHEERIHIDDIASRCRREMNPNDVIKSQIEYYQNKIKKKIENIQKITAELGVSPVNKIESARDENRHALIKLNNQNNVDIYKSDLIKAKKEDLPELFKSIDNDNDDLVTWMSAQTLPLQAQVKKFDNVVDKINGQILNVELYAGLAENVILIKDGKTAESTDKLHVMQRRCYMDEECIAHYMQGGIDFNDIKQFDEWLADPSNFTRILPFPKCIVVFKVRRQEKNYSEMNPFIRIHLNANDEKTFMYIRNGEKLFRMNTQIEFDHKIFPDITEFEPKKLVAKMFGSSIEGFILRSEYQANLEEDEKTRKLMKKWKEENPDKNIFNNPYRYKIHYDDFYDYEPFDPSSIYYDDMTKLIEEETNKYNRIALIIQGLFDRSSILNPHPPVKIWTSEGFNANIKLVYDHDRTLYAGDKPDFEAFRKKCNASLRVGSVTVGQELVWKMREAEKENKRLDNDWRIKEAYKYHHVTFTPLGNPGPGFIAKVAKFMPKAKKCTYIWNRSRRKSTYKGWEGEVIKTQFTVHVDQILNLDGYKPGDYKQFFADPRTRAEYMQWGAILCAAEEYHAGNLTVNDNSDVFSSD